MDRKRVATWCFDLTLQMHDLSAKDDVRDVFKSITDEAQKKLAISGLKECAFSYDLPGDGCSAKIFGYLHTSVTDCQYCRGCCSNLDV